MLYDGAFLIEGSSVAMYSSWVTYRFSGASLLVHEQVWTSDQPHNMADFAPYNHYCGSLYGTEDPVAYDVYTKKICGCNIHPQI